MKKLFILPLVVLAAGSLFLISCGNANQDKALKSPVQNTADTATQNVNKENKTRQKKMKKRKMHL